MSDRKRPNLHDEPAQDRTPESKRPRGPTPLDDGLPARPAPAGGDPASKAAIDIAAKRAEIQAKLAAMKAAAGGGAPGIAPAPVAPVPTRPPPPTSSLPPRPNVPAAPAAPAAPASNLDPELARKIAEAKRKVAEMAARKQAAETKVNPYLSPALQGGAKKAEPTIDPSVAGRGGLNMAAHPLLMDLGTPTAPTETSKKDRYKPMAPKFSTARANVRQPAPTSRPSTPSTPAASAEPDSLKETNFYDARLGYGSIGVASKSHMGKGPARQTFQFKQAGSFVKKGEAMRAEARMEDLKRRILESSQKAGLQSDLEETAKKVRRPPPPDLEWWDEGYLPEKAYDSYSPEFLDRSQLISHLVQHPISIPAPQDKNQVELKPLFLTKKEMKKMRRIRRQAELQDKQDRQKMGLLPPDPPKVKISNMMRVLTQDAISDPTKVEAQVRREMMARERKHLKDNAERKLTPEQRREKREAQFAKDEQKGIHAVAFKVRYLSDPSHKFKVKKNALDYHLTGRILHNPKFCVVVVEGGPKSIKKYRQLMLNRIRWTEEAAPRAAGDADDANAAGAGGVENHGGILRPAGPFNDPSAAGEDDPEVPQSLADNYCREIWSGAEREHLFGDVRHANCPSDASAREVLGKLGMLWDIAKVEGKEEALDL
ncbi:U4/U5/U6 small nuclear ribonucleoprotein prp3 [Rhodotorula sphaerocarpa]